MLLTVERQRARNDAVSYTQTQQASRPARDWEAIAIRIRAEGPIPVSQAAKSVKAERGRRGHVSASTLVRWILNGKEGVFLDGIRLSGETWYTSEAALARFAAALSSGSAARVPGETTSATATDDRDRDWRERQRLAEEDLKRMGC
jgi:hypothetical protein